MNMHILRGSYIRWPCIVTKLKIFIGDLIKCAPLCNSMYYLVSLSYFSLAKKQALLLPRAFVLMSWLHQPFACPCWPLNPTHSVTWLNHVQLISLGRLVSFGLFSILDYKWSFWMAKGMWLCGGSTGLWICHVDGQLCAEWRELVTIGCPKLAQ